MGGARRVTTLEARLTAQAYGLGFDLVGIAALGPADTADAFDRWLAAGHHAGMHYLERTAALRRDPRRPVPGMRSAIMVALDYGGRRPAGPVARYARGRDYHKVFWRRLDRLHVWLSAECGRPVAARAVADTAPLLERDLARRAGLGWFGKNTLLIHPRRGSFLLLGALLTELELTPSAPFAADRCGTCTRCLDACPTGAFPAARVLDANRCIAYWTIEHRGAIPERWRAPIGTLAFGCDVCQEVCPWNERFATPGNPALAPDPALDAPALTAWLTMDETEYAAHFHGTALTRAKRVGLARNAAVALGNAGDVAARPALSEAAARHDDAVVREHAAWALRQLAEAP